MLKRVAIENFRCLRKLDVSLRPLTVLVGANDTGKSTFLKAIRVLSRDQGQNLPGNSWRNDDSVPLILQASFSNGEFQMTAGAGRGQRENGAEHLAQLRPSGFYHLPNRGVSMQSSGQGDTDAAPQIQEDGGNIAALIDYLLRRDRKRFDQLESTMQELIPGFESIDVVTPSAKDRRIDLVIDGGFRLRGDEASAGLRLLVFFVALAFHPTPPKLILLEEPESGIHPKRLADVVTLLRELTQGKHAGHSAQVVLTTHSPYLLDLINLSTDQVLVFRRENDGSRTAEPADAERLKLFMDEFMLGEVWYNQGEEGLVARHSS